MLVLVTFRPFAGGAFVNAAQGLRRRRLNLWRACLAPLVGGELVPRYRLWLAITCVAADKRVCAGDVTGTCIGRRPSS
jgi:hypothetical protein